MEVVTDNYVALYRGMNYFSMYFLGVCKIKKKSLKVIDFNEYILYYV